MFSQIGFSFSDENKRDDGDNVLFKKISTSFSESGEIYTDNSQEFMKACQDLLWNHDAGTPSSSQTNGVAERALRRAEKNGGIVRWSAAVIFGKCKTRWQKAKLHSKKNPPVQPRREASPQPLTRQVFEARAKVETRCQAAVNLPKYLPELSSANTHQRATQVAWTLLKNKRPHALMNDFSLCSFEALTSTQSKLAGALRQAAGTMAIVVLSDEQWQQTTLLGTMGGGCWRAGERAKVRWTGTRVGRSLTRDLDATHAKEAKDRYGMRAQASPCAAHCRQECRLMQQPHTLTDAATDMTVPAGRRRMQRSGPHQSRDGVRKHAAHQTESSCQRRGGGARGLWTALSGDPRTAIENQH